MKALKKIWEALISPFVSVAVMIDESKRLNLDGSWNEYHRKRNERMMRKEKRERS